MNKNTNKIIGMVAIIILVGATSFYGGMKYGQGTNPSRNRMTGQLPGQFQGRNANDNTKGNINFAVGEIINKDDKSITIKLQDGGSKIIFYSTSTTINKMADGTTDDLTVGQTVTANGTANTDGSVTAQSIQVRPQMPAGQNQPQQ